MSLTMIMMLTATVVPVFGNPLQLQKNTSQYNTTDRFELPKSQQNPIIRNVSAINNNETDDFPGRWNQTKIYQNMTGYMRLFSVGFACFLSTCSVDKLVHKLGNRGDESAGKVTKDPMGPGK